MKYKNVFYFANLNKIGGVETFYWYLAQKYQDWDIVIIYKTGDDKQINRLRNFVRVIKFTGQVIKCERAFFNYNTDIIEYIEADEYFQVVHGDYKAMRIKPFVPPKINSVLGVSKQVCQTYEELTGRKVELSYNPIMVEKPKKVLNLISATRLTVEKGKDRMVKFGQILEGNNIPYVWTIFTDDRNEIKNENIIYRTPRLDILDFIADADYLVQLSNTEGYGFSVVEALCVGTPVIVTDCPVFRELGVNDKNGFILDFDLKDVPVKAIYKGLPKFDYKPKADRWDELLAKGESSYKKELKTKVDVVCIREFFDMEAGFIKRTVGEVFTVNKIRADVLIDNGFAKLKGGKNGTS